MADVGSMLACPAEGLKTPQNVDVGIVGFSNWQFCTMIDPSLSSVSQPGSKMSVKATDILLDMIEKKLDSNTITGPVALETELLIRKSSVRL